MVTKPKICVYSRYISLYGRVLSRRLFSSNATMTRPIPQQRVTTPRQSPQAASPVSLDRVPGPQRVGGCLSRRIVNRSRTGGILSITICGRCGHLDCLRDIRKRSPSSAVRLRGSGVLLVKPANYNGALLTRALTQVLRIPFTITSTAALARTNCINRSMRGVLLHLLRITSLSIRRTRQNVVCVSRVSGVTHGDRGPSVAHSISKRKMRRTLLGVLRNAITGIPPRKKQGRPCRSYVRVSADGVLFVYNKTFINLSGVIRRHVNGGSVNFIRPKRTRISQRGQITSILRRLRPSSLIGFNLVPRFVNHVPTAAIMRPLSRRSLITVLARPGGTLIGRFRGLVQVSGIRLRFGPSTLQTVTQRTCHHGAKTHTLHNVVRRLVLSIVCRLPSHGSLGHYAVARRVMRRHSATSLLLRPSSLPGPRST